jgi:hypothetical protein
MILAVCECGTTKDYYLRHLLSGRSKSCGCLRAIRTSITKKKHGLSDTGIYGIWAGMKDRCYNKKNPAYKNYGGRGIAVDPRWKTFQGFYDTFGYKLQPNLTMDRIDNNSGYSPENCRWADSKTQANNRRCTKKYAVNGEPLTVSEASRKYLVHKSSLDRRLKWGMSLEDVINVGLKYHRKKSWQKAMMCK